MQPSRSEANPQKLEATQFASNAIEEPFARMFSAAVLSLKKKLVLPTKNSFQVYRTNTGAMSSTRAI